MVYVGKNDRDETEFKYCDCGCGTKISKYNKWGFSRKYISGHNTGNQKGSNNRNYKGGSVVKETGYKRVGRIKEHRLVYEQYYKCCLLPIAVIHHKDDNKLNNNIKNLEPMWKPVHIALHHYKHGKYCKDKDKFKMSKWDISKIGKYKKRDHFKNGVYG